MLPREPPARWLARDVPLGVRGLTRGPEQLARIIARSGVRNPGLLDAVRRVLRASFVPSELAGGAYLDEPLPIPHRQVTTQPSLVAKMVEALGLNGTEKVLEVGSGHGWQTALLAELADAVWSVERWPDLAETAQENLERFGTGNARVVVGDGSGGLPEQAPFDGILVSAAFPSVPQPLAEQLAEGGRLVQPLGLGGNETVVLFEKVDGELVRRRDLTGAYFVRLYGEHGFSPD